MTEIVTKTIRKGYQNLCQRVLKRSEKGINTITKAYTIGNGYQKQLILNTRNYNRSKIVFTSIQILIFSSSHKIGMTLKAKKTAPISCGF